VDPTATREGAVGWVLTYYCGFGDVPMPPALTLVFVFILPSFACPAVLGVFVDQQSAGDSLTT